MHLGERCDLNALRTPFWMQQDSCLCDRIFMQGPASLLQTLLLELLVWVQDQNVPVEQGVWEHACGLLINSSGMTSSASSIGDGVLKVLWHGHVLC